ncbi:MAG: alpha/beta fold hydrolase [Pseudomonadota bacterium]
MVDVKSSGGSESSGAARSKRWGRRRVIAGLGLGMLVAGAGAIAATSAWRVRDAARRFPPIGAFETVEGVRLHLLDQGARDAPAIALIHGASGNLRDFGFGFTEALLERGLRVIAIDRPGHGHSERGPSDAHRPDVQARLMRGALAARGVERALLLGHSLGGAPALAWALDAPDSVLGLCLVGGVAMPWPGGIDLIYRVNSTPIVEFAASAAMNAFVSEGYVEAAVASIFRPQAPPQGYAAAIGAPLALRPATLRANAEDVAFLKEYLRGQAPRYPTLRVPIEALHGAADTIVPARVHAEPLSQSAPNARLTLLPGVGHMPHHTARRAVLAAVERLRRAGGL